MSKVRKDLLMRLRLMLAAADKIMDYAQRTSLDEMRLRDMAFDAISKQFEELGEQVYKLEHGDAGSSGRQFLVKHSSIPWQRIEGMRHLLAHEYESIAPEVIWTIVHSHVKNLASFLRTEIKKMSGA